MFSLIHNPAVDWVCEQPVNCALHSYYLCNHKAHDACSISLSRECAGIIISQNSR